MTEDNDLRRALDTATEQLVDVTELLDEYRRRERPRAAIVADITAVLHTALNSSYEAEANLAERIVDAIGLPLLVADQGPGPKTAIVVQDEPRVQVPVEVVARNDGTTAPLPEALAMLKGANDVEA